jgi:hypothetical protein
MVEEQFKMVKEDFDSETIIDGETETGNVASTETETGAVFNTGAELAEAKNKTRNKSAKAENKESSNYNLFFILFLFAPLGYFYFQLFINVIASKLLTSIQYTVSGF